VLKNNRRN